MAQLNLSPDPIVLGVQSAIFLANLFVVKKLILEPYLSVRNKREASTGGSHEEAEKLQAEALALEAKITDKMRAAHKDAAITREKIKNQALHRRSELLAKAETEAKTQQSKVENEIAENLRLERAKKELTIRQIANDFFTQVAH